MKAKSLYKIPNGKLIKISLEYNSNTNKIIEINITGDFFAYPEESIEYLENNLKNILLEKEVLLKKIEAIIKNNNIQFIGLNSEGISQAIMMCKK
jgi:hypothetical protein